MLPAGSPVRTNTGSAAFIQEDFAEEFAGFSRRVSTRRHAVHFDERGFTVSKRQERAADADLYGIAERGAADELEAGAGQQAHFAEPGQAGHTVGQPRDDGPCTGLKIRKTRAFHSRSGVRDQDGLRHAVAETDFCALDLGDDGPPGTDDANFCLLAESHFPEPLPVARFSENVAHDHAVTPLRCVKRLANAAIVIAGVGHGNGGLARSDSPAASPVP